MGDVSVFELHLGNSPAIALPKNPLHRCFVAPENTIWQIGRKPGGCSVSEVVPPRVDDGGTFNIDSDPDAAHLVHPYPLSAREAVLVQSSGEAL